jgi:hypothetical protein
LANIVGVFQAVPLVFEKVFCGKQQFANMARARGTHDLRASESVPQLLMSWQCCYDNLTQRRWCVACANVGRVQLLDFRRLNRHAQFALLTPHTPACE